MNGPYWDSDCDQVLRDYPRPCRPETYVYLGGAGGFSGACFWRLTTGTRAIMSPPMAETASGPR